MRTPSVARFLLILATLLTALVALGAGAAHAHGADGEMTVIAAEPVGATEIAVELGILYTNDQELAEEAVVTATLTGPDGAVVGPVDVPRRSGATYAATVAVPAPGAWTIALASVTPTSSATTVVEVTGEAPAASAAPTTTTSTAGTATTTTPASVTSTAPVAPTEPSSGTPWAIIVVGVVIVIGAGVAVSLWAKAPGRS